LDDEDEGPKRHVSAFTRDESTSEVKIRPVSTVTCKLESE